MIDIYESKSGLRLMVLRKFTPRWHLPLKKSIRSIDVISKDLVQEFENTNAVLAPLRYLAGYLNFDKVEEFLIKEPLLQKIQGWGATFAAILPAAVTVILTLLKVAK